MSVYDIIIGNDDNGKGQVRVFRGTGIKDNPDYKAESTDCFEETITDGVENVGGTLEIEKLSYDSKEEYIALEKALLRLQSQPTMITVSETIKFKGEKPYDIRRNYIDCVLSGNDYEDKPKEKSTRNLKFTYASRKKIVDNVEITLDAKETSE